MKRNFIVCSLLVSLSAGAQTPPTGRMDAVVSIIKGNDIGNEDGKKDLSHELDGSTLELGGSKCIVNGGKCVLEGVTVGSHIATALLSPTVPGINYRLVGTNAGTLVQTKMGAAGTMVAMPQNVSQLMYKVERYTDDGAKVAPAEKLPAAFLAAKPDMNMKFDIWVRVKDQFETGTHERPANDAELDGSVLTLGKGVCTIKGATCTFDKVAPGKQKVEAKSLVSSGTQQFELQLAADTPIFEIIIDPWTYRPKAKGWKKTPIVTIDKIQVRKSGK